MRVPQVTDRLKEAPAQALRAVFSGVGSVLLVADRLRHRADNGEASGENNGHPAPAASDPPVPQEPASPPAPASPPEPAAGTADGLPLAGYDGLTVPQLRARMRTLDPAQLRLLIAHEQAHAGRDEVVAMFERRIAKIEGGG
jgi:hypothetical protein